jgi:thymidylate kinase
MFIAFEGPDGCGKTSQAKAVAEKIVKESLNLNVISYREPDGWQRDHLNRYQELGITKQSKLLLYLSSMADHQPTSPEFSLSGVSRKLHICDRSLLSTLVFQILIGNVISLGTFVDLVLELKLQIPAYIFALNVSPAELELRQKARCQDNPGGFGLLSPGNVVSAYNDAKSLFPILFHQSKIIDVNAEGPFEETTNSILKHLDHALVQRGLARPVV